MNHIFDSHAHYDDSRFDTDRDKVLRTLPEKGVSFVMNVGSDLSSSRESIRLAEAYGYIYAAVGVHPHEAKKAPDDLEEQLNALCRHEKVRAIGEIGLDYHYDFSPRDLQRNVFERQLILAGELDMPVIIHDREAHEDTMKLLRLYRPKGIVHCFSGSAQMAKEIASLGMYVGFTGVVTFKNARKALEAAAAVPIEQLLVETDCPYMAPEPYRGQRCDSSMIERTASVLARIKGLTLQQLLDITRVNAQRIYGLLPAQPDSNSVYRI